MTWIDEAAGYNRDMIAAARKEMDFYDLKQAFREVRDERDRLLQEIAELKEKLLYCRCSALDCH